MQGAKAQPDVVSWRLAKHRHSEAESRTLRRCCHQSPIGRLLASVMSGWSRGVHPSDGCHGDHRSLSRLLLGVNAAAEPGSFGRAPTTHQHPAQPGPATVRCPRAHPKEEPIAAGRLRRDQLSSV